ncbi:MAG: hypothetical protein EXQ96_06555 [Alphaproteobacteria bacterium]|nr:hypothetical protein [Alphaproteobacteria bacterium]
MVVRRLEVFGITGTELHEAWRLIQSERNDTAHCRRRKLEARLGFEPDEAPNDVISSLEAMAANAGQHAVEELASAIAGDDPGDTLDCIRDFADSAGVIAKLDGLTRPADATAAIIANDAMPWARGYHFARAARHAWEIPPGAMRNDQICDMLKISPTALPAGDGHSVNVPLGLAIRAPESTDLRLVLRKGHRTSRRFEVIRLLSDHFMAPMSDRWLLATDAKTARQQSQRAFAAEFLCPIDDLKDFLGGDYSDGALEEAAHHFLVSDRIVTHQLENHPGFAPT